MPGPQGTAGSGRNEAAAEGSFEVLVVGAGITGSEVAWRCARAGLRTLLVTTSLDTSYNLARDREPLQPPAGTLMASLVPTLRDPEGQVANFALHRAVKQALESEERLHTLQSTVSGLVVDADRVSGVATWEGITRSADVIALCVGSFLQARLRVGSLVEQQGRLSEMAYDDLFLDLEARGFQFEDQTFTLENLGGALPYTVSTPVFEPAEFPAPGMSSFRLRGLHAAGACVGWQQPLPPSYEQAASLGSMLGDALVKAVAEAA